MSTAAGAAGSSLGVAALVVGALMLGACASSSRAVPPDVRVVDPAATRETKALFYNLRRMAAAGDGILYGHQDDLAYGVTWKRESGRSDTRDAAGAYPAVYGWELGDLEHDSTANLDGVRFDDMKRWIREGYDRGGIVTLSWHMDNLASGGSSWDTTRAVPVLLPGGARYAAFLGWLAASRRSPGACAGRGASRSRSSSGPTTSTPGRGSGGGRRT